MLVGRSGGAGRWPLPPRRAAGSRRRRAGRARRRRRARACSRGAEAQPVPSCRAQQLRRRDRHAREPSATRLLVFALERHVRPVRFEQGQIEIALTPDAEPELPQRLGRCCKPGPASAGWSPSSSDEAGRETAHEARKRSKAVAAGRSARRSAGAEGAGAFSRRGDRERARARRREADDADRTPTATWRSMIDPSDDERRG